MRDPTGPGADLSRSCVVVELDVTDGDAVTRVVQELIDREGRLDAVVNNAGYPLWGPLEETPLEEIQQEFDVNVFGALRVTGAAVPIMEQATDGSKSGEESSLGRNLPIQLNV
jgi:NAD(P)-dependent dehydrogenase (short-subunit alcohol dehydrogenase family)